MKLRPLYDVRSKTVRVSQFGDTPDGPRADYYLEGKVKGRVKGSFHGVDYGLSRVSKKKAGPVVLHVHETIETEDGLISVMRRGYAIPDGDRYHIRSTCLFQTSIKALEYLNSTVAVAEGYAGSEGVNFAVFEVVYDS